jgi:hypothetical protein
MTAFDCGECPNITWGCEGRCMKAPEAPTTRMQPRDETAARMEFERAKRLVESHGWTVTAPESVGCESIGLRA